MKLAIESTDRILELDGVPVRLWRGTTENGEKVDVFIHRIGVPGSTNASAFDRELMEQPMPKQGLLEVGHINLRHIL